MSDGRPDFSFSGLKTAVLLHVRARGLAPLPAPPSDAAAVPRELRDLAASFQRAVVTALLRRFEQVARERRPRSLLMTGGVAANTLLRREAALLGERLGLPLFVPPIALSTDNAAMIAAAGQVNFERGLRAGWDLNAQAHLPLGV
jgi:N6-L-threonylcarbamoyladenine synthase